MKNRWNKENLEKCVNTSKTLKEIIEKLGLKVGASSYQTLKTYLFKYNINFSSDYTKEKWNEDNLLKLVGESINHTEVLIKMGLISHGSNIKTLKKYIEKYDIDTTHFNSYYKNEERGRIKKMPMSEVLVVNSSYDRGALKRRLYEEGLKKYECEECGQGELWKGKQMSLILDHINGVNNDNRLENLKIVCPNCAATLLTHAGRNIKSKKQKCECGNVMTYKSKKCRICHSKSTRKVERPDSNSLKKEVKESNFQAVANKYNVSRATIRRWLNLIK